VRLLADLLEHEVRVATELDRLQVPVDVGNVPLQIPLVPIDDLEPVAGEDRDVTVIEVHHRPGVLQHCCGIGRDEELAVTDPQQHRRSTPGHHDLARLVGRHDRNAVGTLYMVQGRNYPQFQGATGRFFDEMRQGLRISIRGDLVTGGNQLLAERIRILDDAVVYDGDRPGAVGVGMGVARGGRAMGRPPRVGNAGRTMERRLLQQLIECGDPPRELPHFETNAVLHRNSGGVVAPILEAAEPFEQDGDGMSVPCVSNDAAHWLVPVARENRARAGPDTEPGHLGEPPQQSIVRLLGGKHAAAPLTQK
jgi:hypothetical protein